MPSHKSCGGALRHLLSLLPSLLLIIILSLAGKSADARQIGPHQHNVCNVLDYGAHDNGSSLDTKAINSAIEDCHNRGGGSVIVPSGNYLSGTIYFKDNVTLDVQKGATILASPNLADYPRMSHASEWRDTSLFVAENARNIGLIGEGTIDGNGRSFISPNQAKWIPSFDISLTRQGQAWADRMTLSNEGPLTMSLRPGVLFVALHVQGLQIRDIHIVDSPNWTVKIGCSAKIRVENLDVRNNMLIPNNDALDISTSTDVVVEGGYLQAGDDALVIGGPCLDGWCQAPAEHIRVNNITLVSRSAGLRIGPAAKGVHDVKVSNVTINDSNRGVLIHTRTNETIEDITFDHIDIHTHLIDGPWWGAGEPISIGVALSDYVSWPKVSTFGFVKNVSFLHITTDSDSPIVLYSFEPGHIQDISFNGLTVSMRPDSLTPILGGNLDLQPTTPINFGVQRHDLPAILVHNVQGLKMDDVKVRWLDTFPDYYTGALATEGDTSICLHNFDGKSNLSGVPPLSFSPQTILCSTGRLPCISAQKTK